MAWLRHAGHEGAALDGVSPPLRGLASDFGKTQSHQKSNPPLVRPPASGSLGSPVCPTARAVGPSMAQRRSLGVLPRGLAKRAHLGEQQGATPNPQPRGQLTHYRDLVLCCYSGHRSEKVLSLIQFSRQHGEARLSYLFNRLIHFYCADKKWKRDQHNIFNHASGNGFTF